jgi:hypothetical protein
MSTGTVVGGGGSERGAARWYGAVLALAALSMSAEAAHVLEMPQKLGYDPAFYTAVNGSLYRYFPVVGGTVQLLAIAVAGVLAVRLRAAGRPGRMVALGALLLLLAFAAWVAIVAPVNAEVARTVRVRPDAVPELWALRRVRWEAGHAVGFVLQLAGYVALVAAAVTRRDVAAAARGRVPPAD